MNHLDGISLTVYLVLASVGIQLALLLVWVLPFMQGGPAWTPCMLIALGYAANLGARVLSTVTMNLSRMFDALPLWLVTFVVLLIVFGLGVVIIMLLPSDTAADLPSENPGAPTASRASTPFKSALQHIEDDYALTAQEGRVLCLCAKGKNAQVMASEMGVSANTVKSHMRTLYAKLGIHSQQELIKLVDEETARARSLEE